MREEERPFWEGVVFVCVVGFVLAIAIATLSYMVGAWD